ncbi:hypothetical protein RV134_320030 [Roseovarius sp. EC-HK134]|nr:hypothetical protein RV420_360560 [Roseovarius sp. EC-SD190]VVT22654.1 hypothetical protein RV134_320030 [Roseovarius sp. EC-HK134]
MPSNWWPSARPPSAKGRDRSFPGRDALIETTPVPGLTRDLTAAAWRPRLEGRGDVTPIRRNLL